MDINKVGVGTLIGLTVLATLGCSTVTVKDPTDKLVLRHTFVGKGQLTVQRDSNGKITSISVNAEPSNLADAVKSLTGVMEKQTEITKMAVTALTN